MTCTDPVMATVGDSRFRTLNTAYNSVFKPGKLSVGLVVPIENYAHSPIPSMSRHVERALMAESLGFSAIWLRDVPFNVPSFGDAGQVFDPFVYLGALASETRNIALGVASIVLPLRHPAHVAKAAATADVLSNGRLILGIASGDRPGEFPALEIPYDSRAKRFRESYEYIRQMGEVTPHFHNSFGNINEGMDMLPKPVSGKLPLLITGSSRQHADWIATNSDGWMTYPRPIDQQLRLIRDYRKRTRKAVGHEKPVMEPLYVDLAEHPDAPAKPIHLGMHIGVNPLREYLKSRKEIGVNHIALNLRFNQADTESTLKLIAREIIPAMENQ